jgi:hypothetical protein
VLARAGVVLPYKVPVAKGPKLSARRLVAREKTQLAAAR